MKKIIALFSLSFFVSYLWGQNGYAPNSYNRTELIDKNEVLSFFSSGTFEMVMIFGLAAIILMWAAYMYSSFQMESNANTHRSTPVDFTPRVNIFSRPMARPAMSTIPIEKKEKSKKRRHKDTPDKRGEEK